MADYPKASKELQEQQQSTLDLIAVQLQVANAQAGPTKDEFQKANTELLREMLEEHDTNKKIVEAVEETNETNETTLDSQKGWFTKLLDHFSWERSWIETQEKKALRAASKVKDFGKQQVDMLKSAAKGLFDLLLTGLGLLALAALFKWLSEQDWQKLYDDTVKFATELLDEFNFVIDVFLEVGGLLAKMTAVWWAYYLFSKFEDWEDATKALNKFLDKFSFKNLFGENSKIRKILRSISSLFGPVGTLAEAADDVEVKKGLWTTLFGPESRLRRILRTIVGLFSFSTVRKVEDSVGEAKDLWSTFFGENSLLRRLLRFIKNSFGPASKIGSLVNIATGGGYGVMFGENGAIQKLLGWIKGFFGGEGKILTAFKSISTNPQILKVVNFLKTVGAKMLKFLGPVTWLIAGYDAIAGEGGFMSTFEKTEGSLWDKTVAGLSAAVQSLVDFFVFDTVGLIEDVVKWSIKKLMGLFGVEESDVEGADWYTFSITDFLADFFGDIMKFLEGVYTFDLGKMTEGIAGMWGKFKGIGDWFYGTFIGPAISWAAGLLGFSDEEAESAANFKPIQWIEDNFITPSIKFLKDNFITPMVTFLEGLFTFDLDKMGEGASGVVSGMWGAYADLIDWLYGTFISPAVTWAAGLFGFDIDPEAVTEFSPSKFLEENVINPIVDFFEKLFNIDIGKLFGDAIGALGKAGDKLLGFFGFGDDDEEPTEVVKRADGGPLKAGQFAIVGEEGPELVRMGKMPGRVIPAQETATAMTGAPTIVNAPSTSVVNSSSPTSIVGAVSSQNPQKKALGY